MSPSTTRVLRLGLLGLIAFAMVIMGRSGGAQAGSPAHIFGVNSTGDAIDNNTADDVCNTGSLIGTDPECTLRAAIQQANATANAAVNTPDEIHFAIAGAGVHSIIPASVLPTITDPIVIDGYTQAGTSANTLAVGNDAVLLIELNGNGTNFGALTITAGNSTVRGLVINRFSGNGPTTAIVLQTGGNNTITGNFIGTDATGATAEGFVNSRGGIAILNSSPASTIGGTDPAARNVILGNNGVPAVFVDGGAGQTIQGNYIGSNAAGTTAFGPGTPPGVEVTNGNNLIGGTAVGAGNLISTAGVGIAFLESGASDNTVQGNYIGVTADGNSVLGSGFTAILIQRASGNLIGGTAAGARNVIVSSTVGVNMFSGGGAGASNTIQGNYIGTNAAGTVRLPTAVGGSGITISTANNTVGGTVAGAGNLIAGFTVGIDLRGEDLLLSGSNLVQGNYIGTNAAGTAALGNNTGIRVAGFFGSSSNNNTIGGTVAGAGNLISGNSADGILITSGTGNLVQGNRIGLAADGTTALANASNGINVSSADNNAIGGTATGAPNSIAFNGGAGVVVSAGIGNTILRNAIYTNAGLGIDLGPVGATANDNLDSDTGANNLQNYPELFTVTPSGSNTTVVGKLKSLPSTDFLIEYFSNAACDLPSMHGEGRTFLASKNVTTDLSGEAAIDIATLPLLAPGEVITMTATRLAAAVPVETSEFSACGDSDGDGYTDIEENALSKDPTIYCATMRADVDMDGSASILDLAAVASHFLQSVPPAPARLDQFPPGPQRDNVISILDLAVMAGVFLQNVSACP